MSLAAYTSEIRKTWFSDTSRKNKLTVNNASAYRARILLIEDCPFAQIVNMRNLREMGYEVDLAVNGKEGLDMLSKCYDAVITDINMPEMDGIAVIESIRNSHTNTQSIPIIVLSTEAEDKKIQCLKLGADAAEDKSISFGKLERLLSTLLNKSPKYKR